MSAWTLAAAGTIAGSASANASITITIFGGQKSTGDTYPTLYQGQLTTTPAVLYTAPASTNSVISTIVLANTTAGPITATVFVGGTGDGNRIKQVVVPAGGDVVWAGDGWVTQDANGSAVLTATVALTGDVTGSGTGTIPTTLATVNANVGTFGTASSVAQVTENAKGLTTAVANVPIAITSAAVTDFNEAAQDAVGTILVDTATIDLTYADATPSITADVINDSITNAKLANMGGHTFKGNNTGVSADPLDLSIAQVQAELGTSGTNTGDVTLTAVGAVANANAASLAGQVLNLQPASASFPGVITAAQFVVLNNTSGTNTGDQNIFQTVTGNTGSAVADNTADTIAITGANGITTAATSTPDALVITGANAFAVVTGTTGTATADTSGDTIAITGANGVSTAATDTPDGLVITGANGFSVATGNTGTATADSSGDSLGVVGTGVISTVATDNPEVITISSAALTGDVTTIGAAATIAANAVTTAKIINDAVDNTKLANMSSATFKGQTSGGSGDPVDLTAAQAKTALAIANTDVSGLGALATVSNLTGPVTSVGAATAVTADAITNTMLANMPANTIKGNNTGGSADPLDLTTAQVATMLGVAPFNAFGVITGNTGTATADAAPDTVAITGSGSVTTAATDTPDGLVISNAAATFTAAGNFTATEKIEHNSMDGRTSTGTSIRVFRPGDFMVGNTYDPTGGSNSTSTFSAMMTAIRAFNDRCMIQLSPGVFKVDHDIIKDFGTNNPSVPIRGPGRGTCILLPNAAPTGTQSMITFNRNTTGGDAIAVSGFTIYNTSGTVYTAGNGILTNGADGIDITEVAFIDLFNDIHVSGQPYTMTTTVGTAVSGVSPVFVAADVGQTVSGPGIPAGTTLTAQAGATGTLSGAGATVATTAVRFLNNTIKCSVQKMVSFNTNSNGNSVGIVVNNGQAGDTYMGPDIVMSDGGGTTRRRACIELIETGHYEITQANLTGSQRGILMDPGASQGVAFGFHTNVLCDSNSINGMLLDTLATTSTIKNIKSVNSWYSGTTVINGSAAGAGVKTQATAAGVMNGFTFTTDRFLNNRTHGFEHASAGATDFRWSDCDMKGNSSVGSNTADGLNVAANIGNWSINGGKYGGTDTVPTAGNQRWGIFVAAGTGNNIKIGPDDLTGNVTGPLSMGATGQSVFINGCPGLPGGYFRGASSAAITTTQTTLSNMLIPKNSTRVTSTYRLRANFQQAAAITSGTFQVRCGATNDAVGAAATNGIVVSAVSATGAANGWGWVEFVVTITAIGASGNIQGNGGGMLSTTAASAVTASFGAAANARASGAGFLVTDLTADRYLTLSVAAAASNVTVHNSQITVENF